MWTDMRNGIEDLHRILLYLPKVEKKTYDLFFHPTDNRRGSGVFPLNSSQVALRKDGPARTIDRFQSITPTLPTQLRC